ncbi:hypothetical protein K469DRAFT_697196 [Zopfia rhizophila CBS 207.26]|uniref:Uncharacterized protein n=1 Tax=Zopfia rhizophila CBS 207.26 TaxID=1314779 RepID=A0A6A6EKH4_9PEZI|nr:hypothetical protein K469DRAFT_697196 [Zopfia rhizophila CBS 207.26]
MSCPSSAHAAITTFKAETLLRDHQRADKPCQKRPEETTEGFDKLQEKRLRCRKKSHPELSEEDKWREAYRILFPNDDEDSDNYLERIYQDQGQASDSNALARYEQFLRRELPPAIHQELENAVEREFNHLEERLKSQLIEIVRNLQLQLFQSYTQTRNGNRHSRTVTQSAESIPIPGLSTPSNINPVSGATLEDQLASFEPPPPVGEDVLDFDAVLYQFEDLEEFEDSAYDSLFADSAYANDGLDASFGHSFDPGIKNGEGPSLVRKTSLGIPKRAAGNRTVSVPVTKERQGRYGINSVIPGKLDRTFWRLGLVQADIMDLDLPQEISIQAHLSTRSLTFSSTSSI